jgi:ubiquinone/menaquinone biosynthesis C-methylase UbiE
MSEDEVRDGRDYLLGTRDEELRRLGFQHQVWAAQTTRAWERAGFRPGQHLLDLGCGPGFSTLDLAELVGTGGQVTAVDVSRRFLEHLERQLRARGLGNVRLEQQDAEALDLPPESLDGAFARWILCFTANPSRIVRRVARALRTGARFLVIDYCNYPAFSLAPTHAAFERVVQATDRSVRARGGDMDVGRMLPRMLVDAGLRLESIHPIVRVARPGTALWRWPESFFELYLPALVEGGLITGAEAEAFWTVWRERTADPAAFFLTPPIVAVTAYRP